MAEIRAAQEELSQAFQTAGKAFYESQGAQSAPGGQAPPADAQPSATKKEDVVEADYEIVDDGKK